MAIRLGQLADSSHRAALIDSFAIFPVAAPGYLADRPIHSLTDLAQAQWIAHSRLSSPLSWLVATPQREAVLFKVADAATLTGDSAAALLAFALHGTGVALLPAWLAQPEIDAGRLQRLLPDHRFPRAEHLCALPEHPPCAGKGAGVYRFSARAGSGKIVSEIIIRYNSLIYHQIPSGYAGNLCLSRPMRATFDDRRK